MITHSIIQKSQLEGANRIDAEYYQPEYLKISQKLKNCVSLSDISKKITDFGAYSQMNFVHFQEKGVRFFRNQDVGNFMIDDNDPVYISDKTYQRLSLKLDEFDILTPRVGTIGNSAIIFTKNLPATANQNLAQIKTDKEKVSPIYLSIFLCSYFGKKQFERAATGNVQPWLNLQQIKDIKIFIPSIQLQQKISLTAYKVHEMNETGLKLYSQAENLLLEELGLKNVTFKNDLPFVVNFLDIANAHRMDAEFYQPKYEKLITKLKHYNTKPLGELVSMKKGIEPGSEAYQEEGKLFIRVSSLSKFGIENNDQKCLSENLYKKLQKDYEPQIGEILLTKDATPGIAHVIKQPIEGIISGGILKLRLKTNVEGEYLALCINSLVGQMQTQKDAGGSIIAHWKPEQIKNLTIPILPTRTQHQIADLVKLSHEARKKSKELLEQAKREVEEMVEKGGRA